MSRILIVLIAALAAIAADADTIVTTPAKSQPESITAAPDGSLILGSFTSPKIYRARPGETEARQFIDTSGDGNTGFLGVLVDMADNMLWACQFTTIDGSKMRRSTLRGFDLASGASKFHWALPGENNLCNDFSVGPDRALYVTDTNGGRIFRVKRGSPEGELLLQDHLLDGVDGITFLDGDLYVNNVNTNAIYRIPLDKAGKAGAPQPINLDVPVNGPDGMRAAGGKIYLAENRGGKADMLVIEGDHAHVTQLLDGLRQPTAIEPAGNILWVGDRGADKAVAIPLP